MSHSFQRILIVSSEFPPQPGGIGTHTLHLATHLQKRGFEVQVLSDMRSKTGTQERIFDQLLNIKVHRISVYQFRVFMYLKRVRELFRLITSVDTIIASGKFSLWMVAFASLLFNRQYIAIIHGTEVNFKTRLLKGAVAKSLKRFSKIVAVSQYTKSLVDPLQLKQVFVIPNGIDGSVWDSISKTTMNLEGQPKLITVGNVTERKGQLNLIKMLPRLIKSFPKLHYHCVGIPTEVERFLTIAKELKVEAYVTFHGRVDQTYLQQLLKASDVFVMLSSETTTGDVEGFGIAILEANALSIPAIGAKGSGIEEAILHGVSGFLIEHEDTQAFESALKHILAHKEDFSKQANAWAKAHDWKLIIDRYVGVIKDEDI